MNVMQIVELLDSWGRLYHQSTNIMFIRVLQMQEIGDHAGVGTSNIVFGMLETTSPVPSFKTLCEIMKLDIEDA
jgi:hypothetical protein